jgi:GNAT superfamily N-acetyltransferase
MSDPPGPSTIAANLYSHFRWPAATLPGGTILDRPGLLVVDSGLPGDTFNVAGRARLAAATAGAAVDETIAHFAGRAFSFAWWVGPDDEPAGLGALLAGHGLAGGETDVGMALALEGLAPPGPLPAGLAIRPAATPAMVADYAAVVAAVFEPPDPAVVRFYRLAAAVLLAPGSPSTLFVGYLDRRPVATVQLHLAAGVAGIYDVVTLAPFRRRGIGAAMTHAALWRGRALGPGAAILQAAPAGLAIYARLGFRPRCEFHIYEWRPPRPAGKLSL